MQHEAGEEVLDLILGVSSAHHMLESLSFEQLTALGGELQSSLLLKSIHKCAVGGRIILCCYRDRRHPASMLTVR